MLGMSHMLLKSEVLKKVQKILKPLDATVNTADLEEAQILKAYAPILGICGIVR